MGQSRLLIPDEREPPSWEPPPVGAILAALGLALAAVGATDLATLWIPPQLGLRPWEFATIRDHFDTLPLFTIGVSLGAIASVRLKLRRPTLAIGVASGVIAAVHTGLVILFLINVPYATSSATGEGAGAVRLAVFETSVSGVAFVVYFAWLCRHLCREARPERY